MYDENRWKTPSLGVFVFGPIAIHLQRQGELPFQVWRRQWAHDCPANSEKDPGIGRRMEKNEEAIDLKVFQLFGCGSKPNGYLFSRDLLFKRLSVGHRGLVRGFDPESFQVSW